MIRPSDCLLTYKVVTDQNLCYEKEQNPLSDFRCGFCVFNTYKHLDAYKKKYPTLKNTVLMYRMLLQMMIEEHK